MKRKTWLWILGWLIIFPLPLTLILLRSRKIKPAIKYVIIAIAWFFYLLVALSGKSKDDTIVEKSTASSQQHTETTESNTKSAKVRSLSFNKTEEITVKVGQSFSKHYSYYVKVSMPFGEKFSPELVDFISEDPSIATINYSDVSGTSVRYIIRGVGAGETFVYVVSKDGTVVSEKVKVIVPKPIEADSISVEYPKSDLAIGETIKPKVEIQPKNVENTTITWASTDETVAEVDSLGVVKAVGGGTASITATTSNGLVATNDVVVDASKPLMNLNRKSIQHNDLNIGHEWSYDIEINGEPPSKTIAVSAGEKIKFWARFTESDEKPDVGEASKTYVVTENDIINGFTVTMNLSVRENGGKNSGKSANYEITFTFTPYDK